MLQALMVAELSERKWGTGRRESNFSVLCHALMQVTLKE
jgi:hypothetical protein